MDKITVSLIQSDLFFGRPEENYAQMERKIKEAAARGADLALLPELWTTAYDLERIQEIGDPEGERTRSFLSRLAREHRMAIVGGSVAEIREGRIYNASYAFDANGELLAEYRKIHLFRLMDEEKYLAPGDRLSTFSVGGFTFGMAICYDLRFPELARSYALQGAHALVVPAEWPHPRLHHWRVLNQARAVENQMFVISCNRVGTAGETRFFGHSMVVDPWGEILAEGGEEEEILFSVIDLEQVQEVRGKIPVFRDRRPDLYRI